MQHFVGVTILYLLATSFVDNTIHTNFAAICTHKDTIFFTGAVVGTAISRYYMICWHYVLTTGTAVNNV